MLIGATAAVLAGCTRILGGSAQLPATETPGPFPLGISVSEVLLDAGRMRGITGTDEQLTIIPGMDSSSPVDIDPLAGSAPPECRFVFDETAVFGPDLRQFRKTTFQYPPKGALISEAAAAYDDPDTARRVFETLIDTVHGCADGPLGALFVGAWDADEHSLHTRAGQCGRNYRLISAVLLEITSCGFPESVSDITLTNMAANVPG
jgi:hypothetical protein